MRDSSWIERPGDGRTAPCPASWCDQREDRRPKPAFDRARGASPPAPTAPLAESPEKPASEPASSASRTAAAGTAYERELEAMRAAMDLLREVRDRLDADAIRTATDIGLAVAEELAGGAIAAEPARVLAIVDEAARRMDPDAPIRIRVAPAMLERLSALEGLDEGRIWRGMALVPDENMEPSGCVVETDFQRVDARIRSRISKLRHLLGVEMGFTP